MENNIFINIALTTALRNYILLKETKDYSIANDFLIYVVGMLKNIYGEENIIGLYEKGDEASFTYLLKKYNVDEYYVNKFYDDLDKYYKVDINNKITKKFEYNPYIIYIQEDLINMFIAKYHVTKFDPKYFDKFKSMLFTLDNESEFVREFTKKYVYDVNYISHYYDSKVGLLLSNFDISLKRDNVVSYEVYEALGMSKEKVDSLSYKELEAINNKLFKSFNLSPIDTNVNQKLLKKIKEDGKEIDMSFKKPIQYVLITLLILVILFFIILKVMGVI